VPVASFHDKDALIFETLTAIASGWKRHVADQDAPAARPSSSAPTSPPASPP